MSSKRILVTGASRGIGWELVKEFSRLNHHVIALSRDTTGLEQMAAESKNVHPIETDITSPEGLDKVIRFVKDTSEGVDIVVHNAGALLHKPFKDTSVEDFKRIYEINVFAVAELTRRLDRFFNKGAHVLAISSMGGVQGSVKFAGLSAYSSSKGAVITLMELLAEEYKERGVSFNALALGAVQTEMLKEAFPEYEAPISAGGMAKYIAEFALSGNKVFNGKVLPVSNSTP